MKNEALFTSNKQDWETPQDLFNKLHSKYHFDLDAAASDHNAKLSNYYTADDDALSQQWQGNVFCNPPYGRQLGKWLAKAWQEYQRDPNRTIVFLIPARTDTSYWHDYIFGKAEIEFLRGRIKFEDNGQKKDAAPFPSAVVVYKGKRTVAVRLDGGS
ncbi:adenine methyltransferase [Enterococcus plantarum]|uniref:Adenine methyltransferase n=1 Tax=Enterococcus plantarum TaxID=1077675 RepID=A0A2W4B315_9ENTE|nr:DNA N-6-adenine-methyltransferase [Enterococcus plantarum]PZL70215.1 adenine methyltransferase [Enterococcus plantarum]